MTTTCSEHQRLVGQSFDSSNRTLDAEVGVESNSVRRAVGYLVREQVRATVSTRHSTDGNEFDPRAPEGAFGEVENQNLTRARLAVGDDSFVVEVRDCSLDGDEFARDRPLRGGLAPILDSGQGDGEQGNCENDGHSHPEHLQNLPESVEQVGIFAFVGNGGFGRPFWRRVNGRGLEGAELLGGVGLFDGIDGGEGGVRAALDLAVDRTNVADVAPKRLRCGFEVYESVLDRSESFVERFESGVVVGRVLDLGEVVLIVGESAFNRAESFVEGG